MGSANVTGGGVGGWAGTRHGPRTGDDNRNGGGGDGTRGGGGENRGLGRPQRVQIFLSIAIPIGLNKTAKLEQLREVPQAPIQTAVREEEKALRHVKNVSHPNCKGGQIINGWSAQGPQSTTNTEP